MSQEIARGLKFRTLEVETGVKLDGKSIWKIHMDFFFENPFFLNLF